MNTGAHNVLIQLIDEGKINTAEQLKSAYRQAVMKTHPDAVGSDKYLEPYLALSNLYEEAKAYFWNNRANESPSPVEEAVNQRLEFFRQLKTIEELEMPYAFHPEENIGRISVAKSKAESALLVWKPAAIELYQEADREYVKIKTEKPMGPYLKHALALNIRPVFHNIIAFHLTGRALYSKQARQNLTGIMHRLSEKGLSSLKEFITLLLDDMRNGPAALD